MLTLTEQEKKLSFEILSKLKPLRSLELLEMIKDINQYLIVKLSDLDLFCAAKEFVAFCKQEPLRSHWINLILSHKLADNPQFKMLPQYKIHPFDLLRGIIYSEIYIHEISHPSPSFHKSICDIYLTKAREFGSFYASAILNNSTVIELQKRECNVGFDIPEIINSASAIAQKHGTPGYIMLALTYLHIGRNYYYTEQDQLADAFIILAVKNFFIAWSLVPFSKAAINNAFFGKNLFAGFNLLYDTAIFHSWEETIKTIKEGFELEAETISETKKQAAKEAAPIIAEIIEAAKQQKKQFFGL